jgi:hypothetical protein
VEPSDPALYAVPKEAAIDLTAADAGDLLFTVARGYAFRGKVVDSTGKPLCGEVTLECRETSAGSFLFGKSEADGSFAFDNLKPSEGVYKLTGCGVSVEIPAPTPGTLIDNIVLTVPVPEDRYELTGKVLDQNNEPAVGVGAVIEPNDSTFDVLHTDTRGEFHGAYTGHGEVTATFTKRLYVRMGPLRKSLGGDCTLVSGGKTTVEEGAKTAELQASIVTPAPGALLLAGTVTDEDGKPLKAEMRVLRSRGHGRGYVTVGKGRFLYAETPDPTPMAIECTAPGYRAVVLQRGRDFRLGDLDIRVVLKRGPFGDDENIWTAVTGRPGTWLHFAIMPGGRDVRTRERKYRELAAQDPAAQTP